jgi:hypothetical protein
MERVRNNLPILDALDGMRCQARRGVIARYSDEEQHVSHKRTKHALCSAAPVRRGTNREIISCTFLWLRAHLHRRRGRCRAAQRRPDDSQRMSSCSPTPSESWDWLRWVLALPPQGITLAEKPRSLVARNHPSLVEHVALQEERIDPAREPGRIRPHRDRDRVGPRVEHAQLQLD